MTDQGFMLSSADPAMRAWVGQVATSDAIREEIPPTRIAAIVMNHYANRDQMAEVDGAICGAQRWSPPGTGEKRSVLVITEPGDWTYVREITDEQFEAEPSTGIARVMHMLKPPGLN